MSSRKQASTRSLRMIAAALAVSGAELAALPLTLPSFAQTETQQCTPTVPETEGPYYLNINQVRRDITEGKPGIPLTLRIQVVDTATCAPLVGKTVDLWHADAGGVYSGFAAETGAPPPGAPPSGRPAAGGPPPGAPPAGLPPTGVPGSPPPGGVPPGGNAPINNEIFLRGSQVTDGQGFVEFRSIYPGWYPGRTTHIHYKVHLDGGQGFTSQLFFDDGLNDQIYALPPYNAHTGTRTRNANDMILSSSPDPGRTLFPQASFANHAVTASLRVAVVP